MKRAADDTYTCPTCKQSLPATPHRPKTLGVFVPVWGPGTCQNINCPDYRLDPRRKHDAQPR